MENMVPALCGQSGQRMASLQHNARGHISILYPCQASLLVANNSSDAMHTCEAGTCMSCATTRSCTYSMSVRVRRVGPAGQSWKRSPSFTPKAASTKPVIHSFTQSQQINRPICRSRRSRSLPQGPYHTVPCWHAGALPSCLPACCQRVQPVRACITCGTAHQRPQPTNQTNKQSVNACLQR